MNRITATAIGMVLAAGLAVAAPSNSATDLVARYYAATTEADQVANWRDWHPEASHHIDVFTGLPGQDFSFSYALSDWENLPDWQSSPELQTALEGYAETDRSAREQTVALDGATTVVTSTAKVAYTWDGYSGTMKETDRFEIIPFLGRNLIRKVTTTYDFR
ncbi:hypothetical protein [uncultured Shimia sp.]|uniref:hypothetical protein n=1 Tax=uncultured Shimia sp. TaxID=573152 RepID=UPI0026081381|nr:hypothetical protein [uncultured Shimia sp.]